MAVREKDKNAVCEEKMQKQQILKMLRENGYRITKQRQALLDIILENECSSCKEIYYKAIEKDYGIGTATVYRMLICWKRSEPSTEEICIGSQILNKMTQPKVIL